MSFDTTELDSNTNDTIYKGVEVIKGMFGMAPATTLAGTTGICMNTNVYICSSYSNYISYTEATSTNVDK